MLSWMSTALHMILKGDAGLNADLDQVIPHDDDDDDDHLHLSREDWISWKDDEGTTK